MLYEKVFSLLETLQESIQHKSVNVARGHYQDIIESLEQNLINYVENDKDIPFAKKLVREVTSNLQDVFTSTYGKKL